MPAQSLTNRQIASLYLRTIGAPDTPAMQTVMLAWFRAEGGYNGHGTGDNNPLNIAGYSGTCGANKTQYHTFPIFCTPQEGANAFSARIHSPNHGYPAILAGFQHGSPSRTLYAIINSGWVTGDTGLKQYQYTVKGVHYNSLINSYNQLSTGKINYADLIATGGGIGPPNPNIGGAAPIPSNGEALIPIPANRLSDLNVCPTGYNRAQYDPKLDLVGLFTHLLGGGIVDIHTLAADQANVCLYQSFGTGNLGVQKILRGGGMATDALGNAIPGLAALAAVAGKLVDPKNWIKILAIMGGGVLIVIGGRLVITDATGDAGAGGLVNPVPIIVNKGA